MNPAAKLGGFALVLALVFGASTLAGRALDPFADDPAPVHQMEPEHAPSPGSSTTLPGGAVHTAPHGADGSDGHP